ncbi:MAG TPA: tryptophan--tRNA ligase [Egibacteraceae bacterium]|nr:tryptophan--tRNA ligase [Actinomycetota bacterium]HWB72712.1 tryptophan--tRNA ligase [Egibacteraceae bacterium]
MTRVLSGIQPTGDVHLGNYVGAISRWAQHQQPEHFFCIVDMHAMTVPHEPSHLPERTLSMAAWLYASGLDPDVCTLFVQSQVHEHAELTWVLQCVATLGELGRMTQFKEKSQGQDSVSVGLFTYPVLQAADILLYQADEVPVGEDQRQHIELTRDIAQRFNHRFGQTFKLPRATLPKAGARIMDLQQVDKKMSKSLPPSGTILLGDDETTTRRKILRAVTDSGTEIRAAPGKPGITNLLDMMAAVTSAEVADLEQAYAGKGYGAFKGDLAEAVNGFLRPVRARYAELRSDSGAVADALRKGAEKASHAAAQTMTAVRQRVGYLT